MYHTFMRQLRELIQKMIIELAPSNLFIRDILDEHRNKSLEVQATEAMQLIRELQDSLYKVEYSDNWPLLRILIAFCYCRLNDVHTARRWAEDTVRILNATNKEWNLAFAYWFLAAVYDQEGYFKDSREQYIYAQKTFHQILNNAPNSNVGYQLKKECSKRIRQIHHRIASVSHERSRLFDSGRTEQKVNITAENHDMTAGQINERNSGGNVLSAPINVNIHVPIDNRSADQVDHRSLQYTRIEQDHLANQEQESTFGTSMPFGIDFTNVTKQPSFSASKPPDHKKTDNENNETPIPINIPDFTYLLTPGLPIYGKASAGSDGQIVLDDPNYDGTIDESPSVRIEGNEYQLHTIKRDDNQISISYDDFHKSLISQNTDDEKISKRYGWLKVIGNSMNDASPVPIENGDYVLFYENRSPRVDQIVIACLPSPNLQDLPLVVKRLRIKDKKRILRSETCEHDVVYEDIEITRHQLMGEVIAIAKPTVKDNDESG